MVPGRYSIQAEFPGFDTGTLKDVRLRPGDNRHIIVLPIQKMQESVNVGQDAQAGAAERNGSAFGTALTRETEYLVTNQGTSAALSPEERRKFGYDILERRLNLVPLAWPVSMDSWIEAWGKVKAA